jgi:hypothetical protein
VWKNFPAKPLKELKKRMKKIYKECSKLEKEKVLFEVKIKYVEMIRESFLEFFMSMFKNYERYVRKDLENAPGALAGESFTSAFEQETFLKKETDRYDFFIDLFNTRAWILFLENKLYANTVEAETQLEFFDSKIHEKYHKKKI